MSNSGVLELAGLRRRYGEVRAILRTGARLEVCQVLRTTA